MPAALSIQEREKIVALREQGDSFQKIASELGRNYETVRRIYHRYVQSGKLKPSYDKCRHQKLRKDRVIYETAIALKKAHPGWGAGLIRLELREAFEEVDLPVERTLQRWFRRGGVQKPAPERSPRPFGGRGKRAHELWAMDAKEQIELADGSFASWLTVTDEGSGAILGAVLFPHQTLDDNRSNTGKRSPTTSHAILGLPGEDTDG